MAYFCDSRDEQKADIFVAVFERAVERTQFLSVLFFVIGVKCVKNRLVVLVYEDNDLFASFFIKS